MYTTARNYLNINIVLTCVNKLMFTVLPAK